MAIPYALFLNVRSHKKGFWGCEGGAISHLHTPIFSSQWEQITKMRLPWLLPGSNLLALRPLFDYNVGRISSRGA